MTADAAIRRYRTVFISDVHLGTRGCQAELLLDFIRSMECEQLYLVGDIVDGWKMARGGWVWPQAHNDVVQKLLRLVRKGVAVTYIPGNHDDRMRDFCGVHFGGIVVAREAEHVGADGRRWLVIHGDAFDGLVQHAGWVALLGDWGYRALIRANTAWAAFRRRTGSGYWSLSAFVKGKLGKALTFIDRFETALAAEAKRRGFDGVVCGHIHQARLRTIDGVEYANDGDWVESCTAMVEHFDGRFELLDWARLRGETAVGADREEAAPAHVPRPETVPA